MSFYSFQIWWNSIFEFSRTRTTFFWWKTRTKCQAMTLINGFFWLVAEIKHIFSLFVWDKEVINHRSVSHFSFLKCVQTLKNVENRHDEIGVLPASHIFSFSPFWKRKSPPQSKHFCRQRISVIRSAITHAGQNINSFVKECVLALHECH